MGKSSASQRHVMRPTAMPTGTPTTRPATASSVDLPGDRAARLTPREADRPQHREIVASTAHCRHQRVRDRCAREQARRTRRARGAGRSMRARSATAVGSTAGCANRSGPPIFVTRRPAAVDVGAAAPPDQEEVLAVVAGRADGSRQARLRSSSRSGRSRCATSPGAVLRPRLSPASRARRPARDHRRDSRSERIVVGANAISSGPSGARPCSTTSGSEPFTVRVPNMGVGWPFTGTARSHRASSAAATSSIAGDGPLRRLRHHRLPGGEHEVPHDSRTGRLVDRVVDAGAEREAPDDSDHPGDRSDQRRAHGDGAATVSGFTGEARADHECRGCGSGCHDVVDERGARRSRRRAG